MNPKSKAKLKIAIGILLVLAGAFGVKLTCQGAGELGRLDEMKLGVSSDSVKENED